MENTFDLLGFARQKFNLIMDLEDFQTDQMAQGYIDIYERMFLSELGSKLIEIFNLYPDAISVLNQDGYYLYCNETFQKMLDKDFFQIVGKHYSTLVHKDDEETAIDEFEKMTARGQIKDYFDLKFYAPGLQKVVNMRWHTGAPISDTDWFVSFGQALEYFEVK